MLRITTTLTPYTTLSSTVQGRQRRQTHRRLRQRLPASSQKYFLQFSETLLTALKNASGRSRKASAGNPPHTQSGSVASSERPPYPFPTISLLPLYLSLLLPYLSPTIPSTTSRLSISSPPQKKMEPAERSRSADSILSIIQLFPYSFCSTSISVNVSMMSPSRMSLKLTRLIPHSKPVGTSLTSSL